MDQARKEAILQLASGKVGSPIELTSEQKRLGLPTSLVYLAGLVSPRILDNQVKVQRSTSKSSSYRTSDISSTRPDFVITSVHQEQFGEFQRIYNDAKKLQSSEEKKDEMTVKTFHLSPRLLPTLDQQRIIDKHISTQIKILEEKAAYIAEELLQSEQKEKQRKFSFLKDAEKERRKINVKPPTGDAKVIEKKIGTHCEETLQCVMKTVIKRNYEMDDNDKDGWSTVANAKKKTYSNVKQSDDDIRASDIESFPVNNYYDDNIKDKNGAGCKNVNIEGEAVKTKPLLSDTLVTNVNNNSNAEKVNAGNSNNKNGLHKGEVIEVRAILFDAVEKCDNDDSKVGKFNTSKNRNYPCVSSVGKQKDSLLAQSSQNNVETQKEACQNKAFPPSPNDRILQLEYQLLQAETKLGIQEQLFNKKLREQKEQFDDQIQALQMRLYISDTKLKNHQDALQNYMKAVGLVPVANKGSNGQYTRTESDSEFRSLRPMHTRTSSSMSPNRKRNLLYVKT